MPDIELLDLFCSAGGCSAGYDLAAKDLGLTIRIVGVDNKPQPRYPFTFVQADAIDYALKNIRNFSHVHASPPCQLFSITASIHRAAGSDHIDLYTPLRPILQESGLPGVVENVPGSPVRRDIVLTGPMFGLRVIRERWFECVNWFMLAPGKPAIRKGAVNRYGQYITVAGHCGFKGANVGNVRYAGPGATVKEAWSLAMGIDWMTKKEMAQAIPPAYTRFIGSEFLKRKPVQHETA